MSTEMTLKTRNRVSAVQWRSVTPCQTPPVRTTRESSNKSRRSSRLQTTRILTTFLSITNHKSIELAVRNRNIVNQPKGRLKPLTRCRLGTSTRCLWSSRKKKGKSEIDNKCYWQFRIKLGWKKTSRNSTRTRGRGRPSSSSIRCSSIRNNWKTWKPVKVVLATYHRVENRLSQTIEVPLKRRRTGQAGTHTL